MPSSGARSRRWELEIDDIQPLTPIQLAMLCRDTDDAIVNRVNLYITELQGPLRVERVEAAFRQLAGHYPVLRSTILFKGMRRPVQVVRRRFAVDVKIEDAPAPVGDGAVEPFPVGWLRDRLTGIEPDRGPLLQLTLLRCGDDRFKMVWTAHALALDDWSFFLVYNDFWRFYRGLESASVVNGLGLRRRRDYLRFLSRQEVERGRRFWKHYLEAYAIRKSIPPRNDPQLPEKTGWRYHSLVFPEEVSAALIDTATSLHVTIEAFLLASWGFLLRLHTGADDVVFGTAIQGREAPVSGIQRMVGPFSNIVPLRVTAGGGTPFGDMVKALDKQMPQIHRSGYLPVEEIQAAAEIGGQPFDHTMTVSTRNCGLNGAGQPPPDLSVGSVVKWDFSRRNRCLLNGTIVGDRAFELLITYHTAAYSPEAVEQMTHDFVTVIGRVAALPDADITRLSADIPVTRQSEIINGCASPENPPQEPVEQWKNRLLESLPPYMVPSRFVVLDELPLGPSGKVDRRRLPDPAESATGEVSQPVRDGVERQLRTIWAGVLSMPETGIGRESDFFQLGGHSLRAVRLANAIEKRFDVKLEIQTIFNSPTIAALTEVIANRTPESIATIRPLEPKPDYRLSYAQHRIWILCQLTPGTSAFNLPVTVPVSGQSPDPGLVERVLKRLVTRHEALRTYFIEKDHQVVQIVAEDADPRVEWVDLSPVEKNERDQRLEALLQEERARPFDLSRPPLWRAMMIKTGEREYHLLFNMHHIISDGWSLQVLQREFQILAEAETSGVAVELPPLPLQYKDYAHWHNQLLEQGRWAREAGAFWRDHLKGELPLLDLPYDYPQLDGLRSAGSGFRALVPGEVARQLLDLARDNRSSLFVVMLAAFMVSLSFLRDQEEIVVGVAGAARQHEDLKHVMGLFVNTLIMRCRVAREEPFSRYLARFRDTVLAMLDYQGYPMELACQELGVPYPELNVFFNMLNLDEGAPGRVADVHDQHIPATQDNKFPLSLYITQFANGIEILCTYLNQLFHPVTIEKLVTRYRDLLGRIAAEPHLPVGEFRQRGKKKLTRRKAGALDE